MILTLRTRSATAALLLALAATNIFARAQQTPQTHTLLATPTTVAWGYYAADAKPVLTIHSGDTVIMQTASTCGPPARLTAQGVKPEQVPSWLGALYEKVPQADRGPGGHILTGPVAIAEAQPGDTLEVRVVKISIDTDWACNGFGKGRGFLPDDFPYSRSRIIPLDRTRMTAAFAPNITIPLHPFFGSMGVAPPPSAGKWNSAPPWIHGGNMDNKELTAGTTVFYPVFAPRSALFEAGDGHAGQGNGEVDITALETFLTGTFQFIVHKGPALAAVTHRCRHPPPPAASGAPAPVATTIPAKPQNSAFLHATLAARGNRERSTSPWASTRDLKTATEIAVRNMLGFLSDPAQAEAHPGVRSAVSRGRLRAHLHGLRRRYFRAGGYKFDGVHVLVREVACSPLHRCRTRQPQITRLPQHFAVLSCV